MPVPSSLRGREFPYWLAAAVALGVFAAIVIASSDLYSQIILICSKGVAITVFVTAVSFALACLVGLVFAVMALSGSRTLREVSRFYVEIIRGVPILVLLFYIAFVGAPALVTAVNWLATPVRDTGLVGELRTRDLSFLWRAIIALTIGYSAFIAEVFRAGILAVDPGQVEAANALGLKRWHRFRFVVMPQAIRTILPPLGNDFVAMVKDSSLVSVLGVADLTQIGKVYASGSFRFFETYSIVAYLYLILTVSLSLALRALERRMRRHAAG
ncbi:amino acid ABC transporter permease [Pararhizobium mangrovi]|uniref:Amino acid ABC transporter permease n=1 Tax=Pararhizobium mangrovi TaxID=2590452 RepID=A0A506TY65_9HYPH|nr:amino acid ABC transporter permease [Pararhizobium mangrovi]TPW27033.1 amino acid ABC transporter permease [Pararhizobium mangrovi]